MSASKLQSNNKEGYKRDDLGAVQKHIQERLWWDPYCEHGVDHVGGGAGDGGHRIVGQGLGLEAGVDVDDMQPRMAILACLLQVVLVRHAFCSLSQGAANAVSRHAVNLCTAEKSNRMPYARDSRLIQTIHG